MKLYIWLKTIINKILGNISPLKKELSFMSEIFPEISMKILKEKGVTYKPDLLFNSHSEKTGADIVKIQWDWQYSADVMFKKGGGDCNSIMRAFQVYWYLKGYNSYLVTIICDDITKCHATCIIEKDKKYWLVDYDDRIECDSYAGCINHVQKKYGMHEIKSLTAQNISWKVVKI